LKKFTLINLFEIDSLPRFPIRHIGDDLLQAELHLGKVGPLLYDVEETIGIGHSELVLVLAFASGETAENERPRHSYLLGIVRR
jgi:hypothetical protein